MPQRIQKTKKLGCRRSNGPEFKRRSSSPSILELQHQLDFSRTEKQGVWIQQAKRSVIRVKIRRAIEDVPVECVDKAGLEQEVLRFREFETFRSEEHTSEL